MFKLSQKRILLPALLLTGLFSQVSQIQAATIELVFSTFTTTQCSLNCIGSYDSPIEGTYSVSIDTSVINTTASTTAYNDASDYNERLITGITNGEYTNAEAYFVSSVNFDQIFAQFGSGSASMTTGIFMDERTRSLSPVELEYTGNLPPAYQPEAINGLSIVDRQVAFYGTLDQGETPLFTNLNEETIPLFLTNFYDFQFGFSTNQNTTICSEYNVDFGFCANSVGSIHESTNGYAYLESVSVSSVPVPAAVWLFSTGLIGLIGIARRKKS